MERENECIGCYNVRRLRFPVSAYSGRRKAYRLDTLECWTDPVTGKTLKLVDMRFCPVCGEKLERQDK